MLFSSDQRLSRYITVGAVMSKSEKPISNSRDKEVIKSCMDIALQNIEHGCVFIIELNGNLRNKYYTKVFQSLKGEEEELLSVVSEKDIPIIKHLATVDGAVVIANSGEMREFGVTLKIPRTFFGHGKRHAFALGTSTLKNIVCILASEEDKHVRLFRDGVCVADIDSNMYVPGTLRHRIVDIMAKPLSESLKESGIPNSMLESNPNPAMLIITGSNVITTDGFDKLKKLFKD
ncbi:MAG: diadenylate cyclase [Candidatus Micrarchaeaceae archaeon]|jgi:DNA integrity scanning protein DisA with diadenylate cyclase activity